MSATAGPTGVSVVIAVFNQARFLASAIRSVLAQTCPTEELIVVDDGSTDDPAAVVAAFPQVMFIRQPNRGVASARNLGLTHVASKFVIFLDADDELAPRAIELATACHAAATLKCAFVYGGHCRVAEDGTALSGALYTPKGPRPFAQLLAGNFIGMHAAVTYRTTVIKQAGGFSADLLCEDYDLFLRLTAHHPIDSFPDVVALYRWHGGNTSSKYAKIARDFLEVQRRAYHAAEPLLRDPVALRAGRRWIRDASARQLMQASINSFQGREAVVALRLATAAASLSLYAVASVLWNALRRRLFGL